MTLEYCPRCINGQMLPELQADGGYTDTCLQCGYSPKPAVLPEWTEPIKESRRGKNSRSVKEGAQI